jgi:hypothetical protein
MIRPECMCNVSVNVFLPYVKYMLVLCWTRCTEKQVECVEKWATCELRIAVVLILICTLRIPRDLPSCTAEQNT